MKKLFFFLCLAIALSSCKKNITEPVHIRESEQMLGDYLFGPLAMYSNPVMYQEALYSAINPF